MTRFSLLLVFSLFCQSAKTQNLHSFSRDVFAIIKQCDTSRIFSIMFNPEKDRNILAGSLPTHVQMETNQTGLNEFQRKAKEEFSKMIAKGSSLGIDWRNATMEGYEFSVFYNEQLKLSMGKGSIKIKSNLDTYLIEIKNMLELGDNGWKILAIDIRK